MEAELEPVEKVLVELKSRDSVLGEIIATLSIRNNHRFYAPELRECVDVWRKRLGMAPVEWEPTQPKPANEVSDESSNKEAGNE